MDDKQKLQLQNMIAANNVEDNTALIRQLKHSHILRENVNTLMTLKAMYYDNPDQLHYEAMGQCNFLFTYYTDIYNKIRKDEIDLGILFKALDVLRDIEDGKLDQHEGAFEFGNLLKKIYVDSALRKAEKLNAQKESSEPEYRGPDINISWTQYKQMQQRQKK